MWRKLMKSVRELQRGFAGGSAVYRPDLHYMRGPGPKWHAKYGNLAPKVAPAASPQAAKLRSMTELHA